MILFRKLALGIALLLPLCQNAAAQSLDVAVLNDPPYAMHDPAGVTTGMAVDLMRLAAEAAALDLTFTPVIGDAEGALAGFDVALPVSATPALEGGHDLTLPLHTATLGVARKGTGFLDTVRGVLSLDFLQVVLWVSALLLLVGAIIWLLERRKNGEMFSERPLRGMGDGFWWAGVTLTTIGYGDKAPRTLPGRAVAMIWMLVGLAVSSSLTATIVAATGVTAPPPDLPEDLRGDRVAVLAESPAERFASGRNLTLLRFDTLDAAMTAADQGQADVVLGAAPALLRADEIGGYGLDVTTTEWEPVLKVAMLPEDSPATETLNRALLTVISSAAGQEVVRRWLDKE
ncbi:ion channel [Jannaschia formosa]|uniref:ion channel n=1 Tax=Jannaschia formosa TaxID=2259592 RepID=UPI000E1B6D24|nr:ion channel [Jannaschia formosa]TFL19841.1 transporter substrate-binding domain-containing protein [Jannaschia formosa]